MKENTRKERRGKVTLSKLTFHKLNWLECVTTGIGLWFLFYPKPYNTLFTVLLCLPILGLVLNGLTGRPSIASLVKISKDEDGRDDYDVADFIDFAAWIILIRVLLDFEFESFYSMIIPGTIAFATILLILVATHKIILKTTKSKVWIYLSLIFNVCVYSYAGTYGANCIYDNSAPTVYRIKVIDKSIHFGKRGRKTHYIKVAPWGRHDKEEIRVSSEYYEKTAIGQTVNIDLRKGFFNIPWYYLE